MSSDFKAAVTAIDQKKYYAKPSFGTIKELGGYDDDVATPHKHLRILISRDKNICHNGIRWHAAVVPVTSQIAAELLELPKVLAGYPCPFLDGTQVLGVVPVMVNLIQQQSIRYLGEILWFMQQKSVSFNTQIPQDSSQDQRDEANAPKEKNELSVLIHWNTS